MRFLLVTAVAVAVIAILRRVMVSRIYRAEEAEPNKKTFSGAIRTASLSESVAAKRGTFDEGVFLNPKTGKFQFPKYRSPAGAWVKVVDTTAYREDIWADLDTDEKRNFSIKDFEYHYISSDIELESFGEVLRKASNPLRSKFPFLKENCDQLEAIIEEFGVPESGSDGPEWIPADTELLRSMLSAGVLAEVTFNTPAKRAEYVESYLSGLRVVDLKKMCLDSGVSSTGKKADLVDRLQQSENNLEIPPPVTKTTAFDPLLLELRTAYVEDVRKSIDAWHPAVIREVWEHVSTDACDSGVESLVKGIQNDPYWKDRLV